MHVGRERPPAGQAWGEEGGSKMEVAHALVASLSCCYACRGFEHGRHRAPPESWFDQPASQALPAKEKLMRNWTGRQRPLGLNGLKGGTVLPSFRSPNPFPL